MRGNNGSIDLGGNGKSVGFAEGWIAHLQSVQLREWRLDSNERYRKIVSLMEAWSWSVKVIVAYFAMMGKE